MIAGFTYKSVPKTSVPTNARGSLGKYARLFEALQWLPANQSACVEVASKEEGYYINVELRRIAKAEGLTLGWSRNKTHTEFFYWLERPKVGEICQEPIRRTA